MCMKLHRVAVIRVTQLACRANPYCAKGNAQARARAFHVEAWQSADFYCTLTRPLMIVSLFAPGVVPSVLAV